MPESSPRVLHVASSILAGAPANLSLALARHSRYRSTLIQTGDFADPRRATMAPEAIHFRSRSSTEWLCRELLRETSIVHIHNTVHPSFLGLLAEVPNEVIFIHHAHSPLYERPLFFDHGPGLELRLSARFAVSHFHPRAYPDAVPMPNIVPRSRPPARRAGPLRVLYSPSHRGGGRWNAKTNREFERALVAVRRLEGVDLIEVDDATPAELFEIRTRCDVTIDEVVTGSYHLVSVEGLAAGTVVINNADEASMWAAQMGLRSDLRPPFVRTNSEGLPETIAALRSDAEGTFEKRLQGYAFFESFMTPGRLAAIYEEEYDRLLAHERSICVCPGGHL